MSHTSDWLDSVQEYGLDMPDSNSDRHLFKVLGSLGSDVKHSLSLLERSRQDTTQLRLDMKSDLNDISMKFGKNIDELNDRVDKLESFQTKIVAYMSVLIPIAIVVGQVVAPMIVAAL